MSVRRKYGTILFLTDLHIFILLKISKILKRMTFSRLGLIIRTITPQKNSSDNIFERSGGPIIPFSLFSKRNLFFFRCSLNMILFFLHSVRNKKKISLFMIKKKKKKKKKGYGPKYTKPVGPGGPA